MKKIGKVLCGILGVAFLATGCATVSNIKNSSKEIVYNGNAAVMVDGYLYYGNSFADFTAFKEDKDYTDSAKLSYLARLNTNINLAAKSGKYSPKEVETVEEEVVGQANGFVFALGEYVYYVTPKREQETNSDNKLEYKFSHSKIYRSKLNGDKKKELYTTTDDISKIEVLKCGKQYYIVFLAGKNLVKINLDNDAKSTTIAKNVTSVALPKTYEKNKEQAKLDWNGYVYYTTEKEDTVNNLTGTILSKIKLSGGSAAQVGFIEGKTISLVGRERDVIFYTIDSKTYMLDTNKAGQIVLNSPSYLFYNGSISNINLVASRERVCGYLFGDGDNLLYKTADGDIAVLTFKKDDTTLSTVSFVNGRDVYFETTTGIYRADLSQVTITNGEGQNVECEEIVKMTAIKENITAFDGKYVYFYAQLEDAEEDEKITGKDANYYLYRVNVGKKAEDGKDAYQLLSLTKTKARHS